MRPCPASVPRHFRLSHLPCKMLRTTLNLIDRPAPALVTTGGGLGVGWVAKWAASASECASVLAPFAALAGYLTAFLVCAWWVVKTARALWRWVRGTGESGEDFND